METLLKINCETTYNGITGLWKAETVTCGNVGEGTVDYQTTDYCLRCFLKLKL